MKWILAALLLLGCNKLFKLLATFPGPEKSTLVIQFSEATMISLEESINDKKRLMHFIFNELQ